MIERAAGVSNSEYGMGCSRRTRESVVGLPVASL